MKKDYRRRVDDIGVKCQICLTGILKIIAGTTIGFSETWMLRLLFDVPNQTCWITNNSRKYTSIILSLGEDLIKRVVRYISRNRTG
jgi:hypothetical protein